MITNKANNIYFTVTMNEDLNARLQEEIERSGESRVQIIRLALDEYLTKKEATGVTGK